MKRMAAEKRQELTVMSGIAILFVLVIHACGYVLGSFYPGVGYASADIFLRTARSLSNAAVPMFLFASGAKYALHDMETPYGTFLKKRLPRVLMSFFIINTIFWAIDSYLWIGQFDPILLTKTYISSWLGNTVAYPLWYIPMYCCVIIACPLVCRIIPQGQVRLLLYLAIGCAQHILESEIPIFGAHPLDFVAYPVFFEMGILVYRHDSSTRWRDKVWIIVGYLILGGLISIAVPSFSQSPLVQYLIFSVWGTMAYWAFAMRLKTNRLLTWLGGRSYPIFLLHEPVIGRAIKNMLQEIGIEGSLLFTVLWIIGVLLLTLVLIKLLEGLKVDRILWEFRLEQV